MYDNCGEFENFSKCGEILKKKNWEILGNFENNGKFWEIVP